MHLFLAAEDSESALHSELALDFPKVTVRTLRPLLLGLDLGGALSSPFPHVAFARQWFPDARRFYAESIRAWAHRAFHSIVDVLPEGKPWGLHIEPHYGARPLTRMGARAWHSARRAGPTAGGERNKEQQAPFSDPNAGRQRCQLIREELVDLLRKRRRHLLRSLVGEPLAFTADTSFVQLLLVAPEQGYLSVATTPMPFEQRHLLSPFPKGHVDVASDQRAPSRAFAKLVEAQLRMGRSIQPGETCVDLGAAPGSWTYVVVQNGASAIAVDRSKLREDLMANPKVHFRSGDAFRFEPDVPAGWLLCDVIAPPERSAGLLLEWLRRKWCRNFIVTLKLKDDCGAQVIPMLKRDLPQLTTSFFLSRLCANKKEVCVFGSASG